MESTRLIYIVDDDPDYRFILQQLFTYYFPAYPTQFFPGGGALLSELAHLSEHPGLILLDRHMPGLDGYQTLLALKDHPAYQTIPVVMMSAAASVDEIDACYRTGVNSFLPKSLNPHTLRQTLSLICQYWLDLNQEPIKQRH